MYNKRRYNKINDKKVLHKVRKQWVILSLSMLAMVGAGGAITTQVHANPVNSSQNQQGEHAAPQASNVSKQRIPAKPVSKATIQTQNTPVFTNSSNKGESLSLSYPDASHQTPSVNDIITAVDSDVWNNQYGSKYTDLLSKLNYDNVRVFDSPTAYNNYLNGNNNVSPTVQYQNDLASVQRDLDGFAAYPKVQALRNLINTTTTNPSTYSPVFSNPLFNGFETTFNDNDASAYNGALNDFSSLENDRKNDAAQASDLQNALNKLGSLNSDAREAVTNFYGISLSDVNDEIDQLKHGYTPQGMVYQPIELKYYDIASKTDYNANNETVTVSRTPIKIVTLNKSNFDNIKVINDVPEDPTNPYTLVNNPQFSDDPEYNSPDVANPKLQVPNGYIWTGLDGANAPKDPTNEIHRLSSTNTATINFNNGSKNIVYRYSRNGRTYYAPSQQQLHFRLVPQSEASQPEIINAYVRKADDIGSDNNVHGSNQYFSTDYLENNTADDNVDKYMYNGVCGKYDDTTLYLGGDFSQYCAGNDNSLSTSNMYEPLIRDSSIRNNVTKIVLEDSTGLWAGNCSYMFANLPHLQSVVRVGNFDSTCGKYGPDNISYMFANDPELTSVQDAINLPWDFYDDDKGGSGTDNSANYAFANDPDLRDISGLSRWQTSGFTKMNYMFYNDRDLSNLSPISHWDVGGVHQMDDMFANDTQHKSDVSSSSLQDLAPWNLRGLETAKRLFANDFQISYIPTSWMHKSIDTGANYPDVMDAFRGTGLSFKNNPFDGSNPDWILLGHNVNSDAWLPKMYRTEHGHYSFTPDSDGIYFGDSLGDKAGNTSQSFNGVFYKNDGYLVLTSVDYTWNSRPSNDGNGNVTNTDVHVDNNNDEMDVQLPSRNDLINELNGKGINLQDINRINLIGYFGTPKSLNGYFSNMLNLQSIQGGGTLYNDYSYNDAPANVDVRNLFANDPKLDSVIGFFGNEQALKEDPYVGPQSQGLVHKYTFNGVTPIISHNIMMNATSTAHMFDGDKSLFSDDNAQANVDAISSIPMDNVIDASYMFNNTGLNDSNIVTNWNLSKLQNADYMFAGCNLTNLDGFGKLGDWTNTRYYSTPTSKNGISNWVKNNSDRITPVKLSSLQQASYMFANNPLLNDANAIENGNNNWKFNQVPNVDQMFSNTDVGYDTPTVNTVNGGYVLGAEPKYYTNYIDFNGDSDANTTVYGELGSTRSENAPRGYHYINGSNGQFTINNRGTHILNVAPNTVAIPVEFRDVTNDHLLAFNPTANDTLAVNVPGVISLNNDVLAQLHQRGYQLDSDDNYNFTVTPKEIDNSGNLYPEYEPILNVVPINFDIPVEYKDVKKDVTKAVSPITHQTIHSTFNLVQYARQHVPNGYQLATSGQNNGLSTWRVADHIEHGSDNTDALVVYMEPTQAKAEVKYVDNNETVGTNPSVIGSGEEYSSMKVGNDPVGLPNGYVVTNPDQLVIYDNQPQNVSIAPESFKVPFNVVTPDNSNVLFSGTSINSVAVNSSTDLELPITNINDALHSKGYELKNPNVNFTLKHDDITGANKFNVRNAPSFAASDINATLPIKFEDTKNHDQVVGGPQIISDVKANVQNNISGEINVPANYQLTADNVDFTRYRFDNADLNSTNELRPLVVFVRPARQQALVVYKDGNTSVNTTPISLGSGNTSNLNLTDSHFEIGAHPSTLPSGYQISNPHQVMYYNNQPQDVAVTPIQAKVNISYEYNGHNVTDNDSTKSVTGNQSVGKNTFDLARLTVPDGYQLSANNPAMDAYNSGHIIVHLVPQQRTDVVNFVDKQGNVSTIQVSGNSSATGLASSHFTVDSISSHLPSGYRIEDPHQVINYDGGIHTIMVKPVAINPTPKPQSGSNTPVTPSKSDSSTSSSASMITPKSSAINSVASSSSISPNFGVNTSASSGANVSVASAISQVNSSATGPVQNIDKAAKPYKARTNKGYVIYYNANYDNHDVVTYRGHKYVVHYNNNGKNTIRVKINNHYKNIVVSAALPTNDVDDAVVRAVDMIDFSKPAKHVWSWKSANKVLNRIKVGEVVSHYDTRMARISVPNYYRYVIINKKALAHRLINEVGSVEKHALGLKKNGIFYINRIIVLHGRHGNYVRYEFKINKRNFWITARGNYVGNAYLQPGNVKGKRIMVIHKCCLYTSPKYSKYTFVRSIKPGVKLSVKKVILIGKKSNHQTRLLLSNGDYITANKQFVKVI